MAPLVAVDQIELPSCVEEKFEEASPKKGGDIELVAPIQDGMGMEGEHEADAQNRDSTDTKVESLKPCCASFCAICALYCDFPECIGCSGQGECLCFGQKGVCCKCIDSKDDAIRCCMCTKGECWLQWPKTCCFAQEQCCCIDYRAGFPCRDEIPCMFNILCLTCCADWKKSCMCCKNIGELVPRLNPENKQ